MEEAQPISILLAPKGPALRLRECWLAECVGGRVARAGLSGAVLWASQEVKSLSGSVPFKLQVRPSGQPAHPTQHVLSSWPLSCPDASCA